MTRPWGKQLRVVFGETVTELALAVLDAVGLDVPVEPVSAGAFPSKAARPANSVLDNAALRLCDIPLLRDFREPLGELVAKLTA